MKIKININPYPKIKNVNNKNEYYLADVIKMIKEDGGKIKNIITNKKESMININTPNDLSLAKKIISERIKI